MSLAGFLLPLPTLGQYLICAECGNQASSVSSCCNFCGTLLRRTLVLRICSNCKSRIPASARFCPKCGQKQPRPEPNSEKRARKIDTKGWNTDVDSMRFAFSGIAAVCSRRLLLRDLRMTSIHLEVRGFSRTISICSGRIFWKTVFPKIQILLITKKGSPLKGKGKLTLSFCSRLR